MGTLISYDEKDEFGTIYINRPEKRNAISVEMAEHLSSLLNKIKESEIKFLVFKSAGDNVFCAGGDLNDFHEDLTENEAYETLHTMKQVLFQIVSFPVPTICLLQGDALGGGCELATACDIRIAKENTKFGFVQSNLGILPGWGGGAILHEKVHSSFAFQWLTEGAIHDATLLYEKGWIHEIVSESLWYEEEVILEKYLKKSILQMQYLKSQYIEALSLPTLFEKMEKESSRCANLWDSKEHRQIVKQFKNK